MKKILLITVIILFGWIQNGIAQQSLVKKSEEIAKKIDSITLSERKLMKKDIQKLEKDYDNDVITEEAYKAKKQEIVSMHAKNIKSQIDSLEMQLHQVVQDRVNYKLTSAIDTVKKDKYIKIRIKNKHKKHRYRDKRTTSYFLLAFGLNNLMQDKDINSINGMPYEFGKSRFFEWGLNYKTRIFKKSSLFYVDYGMSLRYHNLRLKDNLYYVSSGETTSLQIFDYQLKKSRFKNVQFVVPLMLEMDFSKPKTRDGKKIFRRNRSFKFAFGGFAGINLKTKQILKYRLNGKNIRDKRKGNYNVNRFVYGIQAMIGYKHTSFYAKYDLNDLFYKNFKGQHNVSFGLRFDL